MSVDGRLADVDRREPPLERGVLLDVLAVLVERRRADAAKLAAREHRLQQVRGVDGALGRARTDDRVQLVDEEDHPALARLDLREHAPSAAPRTRRGTSSRRAARRCRAPRPGRSFSPSGTSPATIALREPLGDRGLADTGLADQHRVVLRAAREDLDHAADLLVAADHRIELSRPRPPRSGRGRTSASAW